MRARQARIRGEGLDSGDVLRLLHVSAPPILEFRAVRDYEGCAAASGHASSGASRTRHRRASHSRYPVARQNRSSAFKGPGLDTKAVLIVRHAIAEAVETFVGLAMYEGLRENCATGSVRTTRTCDCSVPWYTSAAERGTNPNRPAVTSKGPTQSRSAVKPSNQSRPMCKTTTANSSSFVSTCATVLPTGSAVAWVNVKVGGRVPLRTAHGTTGTHTRSMDAAGAHWAFDTSPLHQSVHVEVRNRVCQYDASRRSLSEPIRLPINYLTAAQRPLQGPDYAFCPAGAADRPKAGPESCPLRNRPGLGGLTAADIAHRPLVATSSDDDGAGREPNCRDWTRAFIRRG
jgi:hypothetical protein